MIDLKGLLFLTQFLEDHGKTAQGAEMAGLKRQRLPQIVERGPVVVHKVIGRRAPVIGFGKVGGVVDGGREVLDRRQEIAGLQRVGATLQQKVHRGGAAARPPVDDPLLDPCSFFGGGFGQTVEHLVQRFGVCG